MHAKSKLALATVFLGTVAAFAAPANAACKKFGFTVNDYGKVGPTNDAKNLLDKHIAQWASQNGVTNYSTGKKSVSCELFIDVILFDEYTCTASATVCWGDDARKTGQQSAVGEDGDHPGTPMRKAVALGEQAPQTAAAIAGTPSDDDAAADETVQADAAASQDDAAPSETYAADAAQEGPADASGAYTAAADVIVDEPEQPPVEAAAIETPAQPLDEVAAEASQPLVQPAVATAAAIAVPEAPVAQAVETGALQSGAGMVSAPSVPAAAPASAVPSAADRAAAASAAAAAAAAAERAAQAAETAANAAKAAAAAAVAASEASQKPGHASVPPLDQAADAGVQ